MGANRFTLALLGHLPPHFNRRQIIVLPEHTHRYNPAEWRDAIVVIARGQIELESVHGSRQRFARGSMLWLDQLPLRALHNPGRSLAVLISIARRCATNEH